MQKKIVKGQVGETINHFLHGVKKFNLSAYRPPVILLNFKTVFCESWKLYSANEEETQFLSKGIFIHI